MHPQNKSWAKLWGELLKINILGSLDRVNFYDSLFLQEQFRGEHRYFFSSADVLVPSLILHGVNKQQHSPQLNLTCLFFFIEQERSKLYQLFLFCAHQKPVLQTDRNDGLCTHDSQFLCDLGLWKRVSLEYFTSSFTDTIHPLMPALIWPPPILNSLAFFGLSKFVQNIWTII